VLKGIGWTFETFEIRVLREDLKGGDNLGDMDIDVRKILRWILRKQSVKLIHIAQDNVLWQDLVNTAMNFRVP
jgi:hypothetical protein